MHIHMKTPINVADGVTDLRARVTSADNWQMTRLVDLATTAWACAPPWQPDPPKDPACSPDAGAVPPSTGTQICVPSSCSLRAPRTKLAATGRRKGISRVTAASLKRSVPRSAAAPGNLASKAARVQPELVHLSCAPLRDQLGTRGETICQRPQPTRGHIANVKAMQDAKQASPELPASSILGQELAQELARTAELATDAQQRSASPNNVQNRVYIVQPSARSPNPSSHRGTSAQGPALGMVAEGECAAGIILHRSASPDPAVRSGGRSGGSGGSLNIATATDEELSAFWHSFLKQCKSSGPV